MTWCSTHTNGLYDAFPDDPTQWFDTDGDGYGDNASGTNGDRFPNNANQWSDTDGDGYGDNTVGGPLPWGRLPRYTRHLLVARVRVPRQRRR